MIAAGTASIHRAFQSFLRFQKSRPSSKTGTLTAHPGVMLGIKVGVDAFKVPARVGTPQRGDSR
jgi:hypothetical protein